MPKRKRTPIAAVKDFSNEAVKEVVETSTHEQQLGQQYWLMKAEPNTRMVKGIDVKFSIDDLAVMPDGTSPWDGVRNYEARNIIRDKMRVGDSVLFYHSSCQEPGVVGVAKVVRAGFPDHNAFDTKHPYYDAKYKDQENPRWYMVDIKFVRKLDRLVSLKELKAYQGVELKSMYLLGKGRLSVQPVSETEFECILRLSSESTPS